MVGQSLPEIPCTVCAKPVDLSVDLSTDEDGGAVHEDCYVKRIKASSDAFRVRALMTQWRDSKLA